MEIHVVNTANRHLYGELLKQFFEARYRIYVEEKGWRGDNSDRVEIDQFDIPSATYLIGIVDGQVMTGTRLLPMTGSTMLADVFPHMHEDRSAIDCRAAAEWTRGFIVPEYREKGHGPIKGQFCGTVMAYCIEEGIAHVGGVQDCYWLPLWKRFGWNVVPVGSRSLIDGRECVAAFFEVTPQARDAALRRGGLDRSLLVRRGPYASFLPRKEVAYAA